MNQLYTCILPVGNAVVVVAGGWVAVAFLLFWVMASERKVLLELAVHVATPLSPPVECLESLFSTPVLFCFRNILNCFLFPKMLVLPLLELFPLPSKQRIYFV